MPSDLIPVVEVNTKTGERVFRDVSFAEFGSSDPSEALAAERAGMVCSRFQAKAALHNAGLLSAVQDAMESADPVAQIAWTDAVEFRRNSPTIAAIASELDLTDEQIDDLFRTAMQIEA